MNRKKLDRLDRLRESANDSARNFRTVYISYLIIALYILSIVIFREDELLFRNGSLQIAIVNFSVPIESFFIVSPLILLALHFNLLIQAMFLSRKVRQYVSAINDEKMKIEMCGLLFPAPLAHMIAGGDSDSTKQILLLAIIVLSIIFLPPIILISIEIQFLAYQSKKITILQSILVAVDVGILWWLWPRITASDKNLEQWFQIRQPTKCIFVAMTMIFVFVSASISTWIHNIHNIDILKDKNRFLFYDRELVKRRPPSDILSAYLDNCGEKRCDEAVIDPGTSVWCRYARPLDLKERVFKDADLSGAILCAVDFQDAILNNAELNMTKLNGANFFNAKLHGALLIEAELHGANLSSAGLHDADLAGAKLHGAYLFEAELHGANLRDADLRGADLRDADLHGADLSGADLRGSDLREAKLYGADLTNTNLGGVDLRGAKLYGTKLVKSNLLHADLRTVDFSEPDFSELYTQLTETINNSETKKEVRDRIQDTKNHRILIDPLSIKYAIIHLPSSNFVLHLPQVLISHSKYRKKLATYLVESLACKDKSSGYVVKGIARRALADRLLGPQLAENLLKAECPAVMNMLPEQLRADLEKITLTGKARRPDATSPISGRHLPTAQTPGPHCP